MPTLDGFSAAAMALVMPKRLIAEFGQVPLRVAGSTLLYLAFEERMDAAVSLGVEQMCGLKAESGLLPGSQFEAARAAVLAADGVPAHMKIAANATRYRLVSCGLCCNGSLSHLGWFGCINITG